MVFYAAFNSISVISQQQLTLFMSFLAFTSTRLGSEVSCPRTLPKGLSMFSKLFAANWYLVDCPHTFIMFLTIHFKDHDRCKDYLSNITGTVQRRIPVYLPHLQHLIQRPCYDRLSIVAADILLMTYEHFVVVTDQVNLDSMHAKWRMTL